VLITTNHVNSTMIASLIILTVQRLVRRGSFKTDSGLVVSIGGMAAIPSIVQFSTVQSGAAVRSSSANDAHVALQNWYLQLGSDQQTSGLFYRGLTSEEALPGMRRYWQQRRSYLHPDFSNYVDELLVTESNVPVDIYSEYRIPQTESE
jgi:hypothetical protein